MYSTKEIKRLYHEEKFSVKQVADILGCSPGLVTGRLGNNLRSREAAGRIRSVRSFYGFIPREFKNSKWLED